MTGNDGEMDGGLDIFVLVADRGNVLSVIW